MNMTKKKVTTQSSFAKTLIALMAEKELRVREAARIAGVGASTIVAWRAGSAPTDFLAVKKLANYFNVSLSFLLIGSEESKVDQPPSITEVFEDGGALFDGFAKITIQRLIPRKRVE
jgi:transcriptional regulator with XRE-family HTH domain